jgi:S-adenosylmethionine decarboxylase
LSKKKLEYGFGPHLILNCYGCSKKKLANVDLVFRALDKFPKKIGMSKVSPPLVFKYSGSNGSPSSDDWGISGVVLIPESHITIHTFPERQHAFIDIFASREFDASFAVSHLTDLFEASDHEAELSSRGLEFSRNRKNMVGEISGEGKTI